MKLSLLTGMLVFALAAAMVGSVSADIDINSCGEYTNSDVTYHLTDNIGASNGSLTDTDSWGNTCLFFNDVNNVTLDCHGYTIERNDANILATFYTNASAEDLTTLSNCNFVSSNGYVIGVVLDGSYVDAGSIGDFIVENNTMYFSGSGYPIGLFTWESVSGGYTGYVRDNVITLTSPSNAVALDFEHQDTVFVSNNTFNSSGYLFIASNPTVYMNTTVGNTYLNSSGTGFSEVCINNGLGICTTSYNVSGLSIDYLPVSLLPPITSCNGTYGPCGGGCARTNMSGLFYGVTDFDNVIGDITWWNTSCVVDMRDMFYDAIDFNQDIGDWDTSNVVNMYNMFEDDAYAGIFNQDLSGWDVGNVKDISNMFYGAPVFNQPLNSWNIGSVTRASGVFYAAASFNQPLNLWDTSNIQDMSWMFGEASLFNQNISGWNTSSVVDMSFMFGLATDFDQDLSAWDVSQVNLPYSFTGMFTGVNLSVSNYDSLLSGWSSQVVNSNLTFDGGYSQYTDAVSRDILVSTYNWTITDGGALPPVANFTVNTTLGALPLTVQFTDTSTNSPTTWAWDFQNDGIVDNTTQNPIFTYSSAGNYTVNLTVNGGSEEVKVNYITVYETLSIGAGTCNPAPVYPNELDGPSTTQLNVSFVVNSAPIGALTSAVFANLSGSCSYATINATARNYTCTYPIHYYLPASTYPITVTYNNSPGTLVSVVNTTSCTVAELLAYQQINLTTVQFLGAAPGINNVQGSNPVTLRNTGNVLMYVRMTGYDLTGRTIPSNKLLASSFKAGSALNASYGLSNAVSTYIGIYLAPGQNVSSSAYMWLSMPSNQYPQDYYSATPWELVGASS